MTRVCLKHGAPVESDKDDHMFCARGCKRIHRFSVVDDAGRKVATVTACRHRGRSGAQPCPECGSVPTNRRQVRNDFERELADADTSIVRWR